MLLVFSISITTRIRCFKLIEFQADQTVFGSMSSRISHRKEDVAILDYPKTTTTEVIEANNNGRPIIFKISSRANEHLSDFLLNHQISVPVYFTFDELPVSGYTHIKTDDIIINRPIDEVELFNFVTSFSSRDSDERVLVTAHLDSFSPIPSAPISLESTAYQISVFLETMRHIAKLQPGIGFDFALVDGKFCGYDGLDYFLSRSTQQYTYSVSLESLESSSSKVTGHTNVIPSGRFELFLKSFARLVNNFEYHLSDYEDSHIIFKTPAVSIVSGSHSSEISKQTINNTHTNLIVYSLVNSLLFSAYNISGEYVPLSDIHTEHWNEILSNETLMPHFRNRNVLLAIYAWMSRLGRTQVEHWKSSDCYRPYSFTESQIVFYTLNIKRNIGIVVTSIIVSLIIHTTVKVYM